MSRPSRIDQHDIAHIASQGLFVMGHCGLAGDLKDRDIVIRTIEANIPLRQLNPRQAAALARQF